MTPNKNITVNFVQYEPYGHYPNHVAHLGYIGSDEFIRNTLGVALFPEHYKKDKQK